MDIPLNPDQRQVLLVHPDDFISMRPCSLMRGQARTHQRKTAHPQLSGATEIKLGELRVYTEYQFRDLETNLYGTLEFFRTSDNPLGLEQVGNEALCVWYHCKSLDFSWLLAAIGYPNGHVWVDTQYECYSKIKDLKRHKLLRMVLDHAKVQSTPQQRQMISFLALDVSKTLPNWAKHFATQTGTPPADRL